MPPRHENGLGWLTARPIAHRGLHDIRRGVPENSIAAARAAIEGGYAIECDVQISADGTPYVFHDHSLQRLTGETGEFRALSDTMLRSRRLQDTAEAIPTVAAFLDAVNGQVPIVMELKGGRADLDTGYFDRLRPLLAGYAGKLALMSFDEWLIDQMLADRLPLPVGLTALGTSPEELRRHTVVFGRGCDFVSYNVADLPNPFVASLRAAGGVPVISWTVRTAQDVDRSAAHADQMTFEGFLPRPGGLSDGSESVATGA